MRMCACVYAGLCMRLYACVCWYKRAKTIRYTHFNAKWEILFCELNRSMITRLFVRLSGNKPGSVLIHKFFCCCCCKRNWTRGIHWTILYLIVFIFRSFTFHTYSIRINRLGENLVNLFICCFHLSVWESMCTIRITWWWL